MKINELREKIAQTKPDSAFRRGVKLYAIEMLDSIIANNFANIGGNSETEELSIGNLLNHAGGDRIKIGMFRSQDAQTICYESSQGGNFFIYDSDIAERLSTPSELKRKRGGELPPCGGTTWLDVQGRALFCAVILIQDYARR